ncbi:stage II sporulation protein P [Thalassobacillus devorans]|uniref:stage II sporulation protein P n=1 Tax=Thalassobacillus devorans TaxID=279813 RepID=UPI0007820F6D|nr:stage II sporulation protein P [Thalassobacillus devorans]NIK27158.1 stage II sporulation protein P [Thalassobacillus devorans]
MLPKIPGHYIRRGRNVLLWVFLSMLLTGILLSVSVTFSSLKDHLSSTIVRSVSEALPSEAFLFLMAREMTSLRIHYPDQLTGEFDLLKMATDVELGDIRTLLGRELPGLERYHTEIAIAGKGTNFSNIPIESPPPSEEQLNSREVDQDELDAAKEKEDEEEKRERQVIEDKSVLIYHSHSWEAFNPLLTGESNQDASSTNPDVNVIAVGSKLKKELETRGIGAVHDRTDMTRGLKEKGWNYNHSYVLSRELVQEALAQDDRLTYLVDIHRDSQPKKITTQTINGIEYARLFFIVGKENENFEKNLAIAKEIHEALESQYPGISRGVFIKTKMEGNGIYNQDLTERAMLLEFGGVDNNLTELYNSIEAFADVFADYYYQDAETVDAKVSE